MVTPTTEMLGGVTPNLIVGWSRINILHMLFYDGTIYKTYMVSPTTEMLGGVTPNLNIYYTCCFYNSNQKNRK